MKKTLLCFLFLFTTVFYAQVSDIVHCPGDNNFDLAKQKPLLIGNLNPDETIVSFHLSLADATTNANTIANPSNYNASTGSTTIYVRIDNNGTITTNSFNIKVVAALNIIATNTSILCAGEKASLTVTASGGGGQYYYSLNSGSFTSNNVFNNLTAGVYTIQVLDAVAGCTTTISHIINAPGIFNATTMVSGQMATITAIGGIAPYQYSLEGINYQFSSFFPNLTPGNHVFMVKDSNGCIVAVPATILPALTTTAFITKEIDCSVNSNASITVDAAGGQSPYTYSFNGGPFQAGNNFSNLTAGTYTITAKDAVNTISDPTAITIVPPVAVNATAISTNPTNCSIGTITAMATGGKAPYVYSFDGGMTFISSNVFSTPYPGIYVIIVKDSKGCLSSSFTTIIQPATPLVLTASNTSISCNGGNDASLTINVNGGKAPYQYAINTGVYTSSNIFTSLNAGTYTLKVRDAAGCVNTLLYTITEPSAVNANMIIDGNTISILDANGGTGSYQYAIDNGNFQVNNVFTNVNPGIHQVRVKDSNNCEPGSFWAEIAIPITAAISITKPIECTSNAEITVTATGGFSPYIYSIDGGATFQASNLFTNLIAGTYSVTVKDNDDKLYTKSITISPLIPIYADFLIDKQTLTINGQAGTAPYQYSVGGSPFQTNNIFTNLSPGVHQVYITDSKGCQSLAFQVTIENVNQLTASVAITKEIDCISNAVIAVNASGGTAPYSYSINGGANFQVSNVFSNILMGTYSIVVKDANNALVTSNNITILPLSLPLISVTKINPSCYQAGNGIITVQAHGGKAPYLYSIGGSYASSNVFTGLVAGTYNVTVKDANGCLSTNSLTIEEPLPITATTSIANSTTINDNNGKITVTATGGVYSYTYALTNFNGIIIRAFQSSNIFDGLQAGLYGVQVKDANGCIASKTNISIINKINNLSATVITQITCNNPFATLTVTAVGGTIPYQYSADNGITYSALNVFNFTSGSYTLKVRDADNNTATLTATITDQIAPSFYYNTYKGICSTSDQDRGGITIAASGGQPPYTYSFNGGPFVVHEDLYEGLEPGTYTFSIKDANGCTSATQNFTIEEPDPIISKVIIDNQTITVKALGQGRSYEYSLDGINFQSNNVFANLKKGTYTVYIRDYRGCTATHSDIIIYEPTSLTANFEITPLTCDSTTGKLNIIALGGIAPYQYSIDNGNTYTSSNLFTGLFPGSYAIIVKDAQNTTASSIAVIKPIELLAVTAVVTKGIDCLSNASITVNAIGGNGPYTYSIGNGYTTSNIFNNLTSQTYTISAKDAFGCIATTSTTILQPTILSLSNIGTNSKTLGSSDGSITITASGGTAPYQYLLKYENGSQIVGPQSSSVFTGLVVGKYTIEVTDAAGCKVSKSGILISSDTIFGTLMITPLTCTTLGIITINAAGGKYPHQYSFDNGITYGSSNIASNLQAGTYTIKVKDAGGDILTLSTSLSAVNPVVATTAITYPIHCNGSNDAVIQITATGGKAPYFYSINGSPYQSNNTFSNLYAGNHIITVKDSNECSSVTALAIAQPAVLVSSIEIANQTVTVNSTGGTGPYQYAISPNLNVFSTSNTFPNLTPGTYRVITSDVKGCFVIMDAIVDPIAPTINGQDKLTVEFKAGQTLADLTPEGQDIKWYSTPNTLEGKTSKTKETPLPLSTVLVHGTTYYASQTINGIESKERLAVTAKLNGALSTPDFVLSNFTCYPNPVQHSLTINNTAVIDEVEIFSVNGKSILAKKINSEHSEIDLSSVSSGVYLLKVKSEGKTKTVKIVKK